MKPIKKITCKICNKEFTPGRCFKDHLETDHSLSTKEYYDIYLLSGSNICPVCGIRERKFYKFTYKKICSTKECRYNSIKLTKKERYGDENYTNLEKFKNTCLERYGTSTPLKSETIKNKIKETLIEKYGVDNPTHLKKSRESLIVLIR